MSEKIPDLDRLNLGPDEAWFADGFEDMAAEAIEHDKVMARQVREAILRIGFTTEETVEAQLGTEELTALKQSGQMLFFEDHGDVLYPDFQFDYRGGIKPICAEANQMLKANEDG